MTQVESPKRYDLEDRTLEFAKWVRRFIKRLPHTVANLEDVRQLVRASGSIGANYIEANESLGKMDSLLHIRISRKESKECRYDLRLVDTGTERDVQDECVKLINESTELMNIFGAILRKTSVG